jgi:hypothetical protein
VQPTVVRDVFVVDLDDGKPFGSHHDRRGMKLRDYGSVHVV